MVPTRNFTYEYIISKLLLGDTENLLMKPRKNYIFLRLEKS